MIDPAAATDEGARLAPAQHVDPPALDGEADVPLLEDALVPDRLAHAHEAVRMGNLEDQDELILGNQREGLRQLLSLEGDEEEDHETRERSAQLKEGIRHIPAPRPTPQVA